MRTSIALVLCGVLVGGCFDEGGGADQQALAANATAQGLIAFADIAANLETDPALAGEALLEFIKMPVAANSLISPPFDFQGAMASARVEDFAPADVPACLGKVGEPSCDSYNAAACEAGAFSFAGAFNRRCSDCDNPRGFCAYGWWLSPLQFKNDLFTITVKTAGRWSGTTGSVRPALSVAYELVTLAGESSGALNACACTNLTVVDSPTPTRRPRKLVNSQFLVTAATEVGGGCALVNFDANSNITVTSACTCDSGAACPVYNMTPDATCGNGTCEPTETSYLCPTDCPDVMPVCGNGMCEIGEDLGSCSADCHICGDGTCAGETMASCPADCPT